MSVEATPVSTDARARDETAAIALLVTGGLLVSSLGYGFTLWWNGVPGGLDLAQPHLALLVHLGFWIYAGDLHGRRRLTWLLLVLSAFLAALLAFIGYVLPWGQVSYWLAAQPFGPFLRRFVETDWAILPALVLPTLLAFDMWVAHRGPGWRRAVGPVLAAAVIGYLALGTAMANACPERTAFTSVAELRADVDCNVANTPVLGAAASTGSPFVTPAHIVPEWHVLPTYAVLRAVPGKLGGVLAALFAIFLPALAVLYRAERLREGRAAPVWLAACLTLYAAWIALGYLGAQPAEEPFILASRVATAYVFAFFALAPFALHRMNR